jgi:hypothetical protein
MRRATIAMVALTMGLILPALWVTAFNVGGVIGLACAIVLPVYAVLQLGKANRE